MRPTSLPQTAYPRSRRPRPRRARVGAPLPAALARVPCACEPPPRRGHDPCAACRAWERGHVLLVDGTTRAKAMWIQAHALPDEDGTPG